MKESKFNFQRTYAERIRGELRKKWLQMLQLAGETSGTNLEPIYRTIFQCLMNDAEKNGGGKRISASIALLERNREDPKRGPMVSSTHLFLIHSLFTPCSLPSFPNDDQQIMDI